MATITAVSLRLPTLALISFALFAGLAAGCGGGADPSETVQSYLQAIVDQDGEAACEQLSDELRSDIEDAPAAANAGRSCADVMGLAAGLNPGLDSADVDEVEIEVEEDGSEAVATFANPLSQREETIDLVEQDGEWRISSLETRPGG